MTPGPEQIERRQPFIDPPLVHLQLEKDVHGIVDEAAQERLRVQQVPGVVRLVGFGGVVSALPEEEIKTLKRGLDNGVRAEPYPFLTEGQKVLVKNGPLAGWQGILTKRKNRVRLVVSVQLIQRSMAVELDEADLEAMWGE